MNFTPTLHTYEEQLPIRREAGKANIDFPSPWEDFTARVTFVPGFNQLEDRSPQGHGQHGMEIWLGLIGPLGAISTSLNTMWTPLGPVDKIEGDDPYYPNIVHPGGFGPSNRGDRSFPPSPKLLVIHWRTPMKDRDSDYEGGCDFVGSCHSDMSYTAADQIWVDFMVFGHTKALEHLKAWYDDVAAKQEA